MKTIIRTWSFILIIIGILAILVAIDMMIFNNNFNLIEGLAYLFSTLLAVSLAILGIVISKYESEKNHNEKQIKKEKSDKNLIKNLDTNVSEYSKSNFDKMHEENKVDVKKWK